MAYNLIELRRRIIASQPNGISKTGNIVTFGTNIVRPMHLTALITPVQAGSGDPSPSNIRPISGFTGCNVGVTVHDYAPQKTVSGTKSITISDLSIPAGSYTVSAIIKSTDTDATTSMIAFYNGTTLLVYKQLNRDKRESETFVVEQTITKIIFYASNTGNNSTGDTFEWSGILITPTSEITTYPITWQTASGTVYGGYVTVGKDGSRTVVVTWARKQIVKSDLVDSAYIAGGMNGVCTEGGFLDANYSRAEGICTHTTISRVVTAGTSPGQIWIGVNNNKVYWVGILDVLGFSTVSAFKDWLDTQEVYVAWKLATPITYTLSPDDPIPSILGVNNVFADTGNVAVEAWGF